LIPAYHHRFKRRTNTFLLGVRRQPWRTGPISAFMHRGSPTRVGGHPPYIVRFSLLAVGMMQGFFLSKMTVLFHWSVLFQDFYI